MPANNTTSCIDSLWLTDINSITFKTYSSIPIQGLVAWYPFNGTPNDSNGNGYNGVPHNVTPTTDHVL